MAVSNQKNIKPKNRAIASGAMGSAISKFMFGLPPRSARNVILYAERLKHGRRMIVRSATNPAARPPLKNATMHMEIRHTKLMATKDRAHCFAKLNAGLMEATSKG